MGLAPILPDCSVTWAAPNGTGSKGDDIDTALSFSGLYQDHRSTFIQTVFANLTLRLGGWFVTIGSTARETGTVFALRCVKKSFLLIFKVRSEERNDRSLRCLP